MDFMGLGIQEIGAAIIPATVVALYFAALRRVAMADNSLQHKITWGFVILALPVLGALLYFWFVGNKNKRPLA